MARVLASSVIDRGFKPRSGQTTEDYEIDICCFSARSIKEKDWLARNHDVSQWGVIFIHRLVSVS